MLIRQTILYLPAQAIGPLVQFIAAAVWTHWLFPEAYGVLAFVLALQELAAVPGLNWWSLFMLRHIKSFSDVDARARWQRTENGVALVGALCEIALTSVVLLTSNLPLSTGLMIWSCFYIVVRTLIGHLAERARGEGRIALYTVAQLVGPIVGFGVGLALVKTVSASAESVLAGLAIVNALAAAALWTWMKLGVSLTRPDREILKQGLRFGLPLIFAGVIAWASPNGIRFIVDHAAGSAAMGLVSLGWGLGQRFASVIAMAVTAAAFPLAVGHMQANRRAEALGHISLNAAILFGLLAPATAGILLLTPDLVDATIAEPFRSVTIAILPISALAGSVRNFRLHFSDQAMLLLDRTLSSLAISVLEATATLILCWLGYRWDGLVGAALGCLAGSLVAAAYSIGLGVLRHGLPVPRMELLRILAATLVMSAVLRAMPWTRWASAATPRMAAETIVGMAVYGLCLVLLSPRATLKFLRRLREAANAGARA